MNKIKIGGVNEHFNMPWKLLLESAEFKTSGLKAQWTDYPGGTGAMVEDLNSGDLDMAVLLTEGAIKALHENGRFKILSFYVKSPLIWGIHVAGNSPYQSVEEVQGKKYAISRFGSGSHIMSYIHAKNQNWPIKKLQFELVNHLEGAISALREQQADIFLWEKYTTQPYVDRGDFRRIGEVPTPFHCFVIAVSNEMMQDRKMEVNQLMQLLFDQIQDFNLQTDQSSRISDRYQLAEPQVQEWLNKTQWVSAFDQNFEHLNRAQQILLDLDLIPSLLPTEQMTWGNSFPL